MKRREFLLGVAAVAIVGPQRSAYVMREIRAAGPVYGFSPALTALGVKPIFSRGEFMPDPKCLEALRNAYLPQSVLLGSHPRLDRPGIT